MNKKFWRFLFSISLLKILLNFIPSAIQAGDTLNQVSVINALMQGIYDGSTTFAELKKLGNFGLGTVNGLDGEMIAFNGNFFQITGDGKVHSIPNSARTPFAVVTFFQPEKSMSIQDIKTFQDLQRFLDKNLSSPNLFYAISITGTFSRINMRSVPKQKPPYRPLTEVVKKQSVFNLSDIHGRLIGFRCPTYANQMNVPGYHFHFLSENQQHGGHVLDCAIVEGKIAWDTLDNLKVFLPQDTAFLKADLSNQDEQSLQAVEKGVPTLK